MKKSIFLFFAAILCATNAWGAKLFFDHSSVNYPADGALVAIWSWGGSSSDAWSVFKASGANNIIVADIADGRTGGKIVRFNSSVTKPDWNASKWNETGDISFPSDKNCIKITSWNGATTGTWSKFQLESQASITPSASSVSVGEEVTFTPALTSNQEYNDVLSTTYSVGAGATITDGKFVATEAGTYTVTATVTYNAQGYTNITKTATATCSITVSEVAVPHPVTGVTIAPTSVTIKQGATATLTATVSPSNADDPSITWSSDNTSVATVVNGVVTAVAAGTANITVTTVDGGFTATCAVKVKPSQYTFYAINSAQWPTVAAHYWGGADGGSSWPGADMVKESETINGFNIYSITISSDFTNIMFTNKIDGDNNKKTADLTTEGNDGKYYDIKDAKWYASLSEVPVSYDYYIAGTEAMTGHNWNPVGLGIEDNDGDGIYSHTFTLDADGDYQFKVTQDNDWNPNWGYSKLDKTYDGVTNSGDDGENIKINLTETKTITVHFDSKAGSISLEGLDSQDKVTYDYYIAGTLPGAAWNPASLGIELVEGKTDVYEATFDLAANTDYEFKITDGQWNSDSDNSHEHTTLAAVYVGVTGGNGNNIIVNLAEAKELTITFNSTEDKIYFNLDEETASLTYRVQVPEGTEACYIAGPCNSWAFREMTREGTTNIFTIDIVGAKETDEYKYSCKEDWAYAEVREADENGNSNRKAWTALDEVTEWGKPVIVTYQLKGVGGWEQPGIELVQNPGNDKEYMLTCQAISATDAIKVVRLENGEIKDYYGNGTVKDDVEVTVEYDDQANIKLPAGTYNFYFDTAESEKKLWIAAATDCVTEPTTVTLNYDLTTDAVTNKMGRRYVTAEDATLGEVQIILPYFSAETTEYAEAFLVVGSEPLNATATYAADAENNLEVYTAIATSEDGATIYNVTMNVTVPATQEYTFLATNGAEYVTEDWGEEGEPFIVYMISGEGYLNDETVEFEMMVDPMGNLEATINDVYVMGTATNPVEEEGTIWLQGSANDEAGNTYNIEMYVAQAVEEVEIVITDEVNVTLGYLNLDVQVDIAMVTAGNEELPLSFWLTLLETENYYGSYGADMFSNIWYGDNQLQSYGNGTYNQNGLVVSFISEPDEAGNATKYNFTLKKDEIYSRAVTNQWGTICLPKASSNFTGATFYEVSSLDPTKGLWLDQLAAGAQLEAGKPYIFQATASVIAVTYTGAAKAAPVAGKNGLTGTFEYIAAAEESVLVDNYIIANDAVWVANANNSLPANRAYINAEQVPTETQAEIPGRRRVCMGENAATGLDQIVAPEGQAVKAIVNGQLIIIRDGVKYNVQGQVIK